MTAPPPPEHGTPDPATPEPGAARVAKLSSGAVLAGVLAPSLVFEIGLGAILPVVALAASDLGASLAGASVLVALLGVGQVLGDIPAGALAARVGDRRAMLVATILALLTLAGCALAPNLLTFGIAVLGTGAASSVFHLARHSYLTEVTPVVNRARAMSTLGGVSRIGAFLGPFLGAAVLHFTELRGVFWLAVGTALAAGLVVLVVPDVEGGRGRPARTAAPRVSTRQVLAQHWRVLATLGSAVVLVGAVRASKQVVLPLWSEHIGLSPTATSLVFGLSGAVDMLLFYPAGKVMDRRGRMWVAVPSMLVLGLSIAVLPLTHSLASLAAVAMVMGLGNGIGSGILMTLGADVAPVAGRSQFLGAWRLLQDSGAAAGPLVVSAGAALGSLAAGIATIGGLGLLAAGALARWVPRWSVHANATTRRRAGVELSWDGGAVRSREELP
ncbi:MFS transporter [Cellulomonas timonensis]|uniref:MFS transporter n=1 Tax=Cellulomonas timonensis TaxID=1689271 RepID=UPI0009EF1FAC|nr:MFS transporter [Cellulomonas timonensis]